MFFVAPILACAPAFVAFAIIPWGPEVSIFHHWTPLHQVHLPVAVLLVLAMSSVGVYGIVLAGWASRGPYSILGALRSTAQVISYEIAMALSFVAVFLDAGRSRPAGSSPRSAHWYFSILLPSFLIYLVTMVGETNRIPFDLPEGEGEIVAGHVDRVLLDEVRHVLPGRVHQHDDGLRARHDAVPRRLAGARCRRHRRARGQQRLVAGAVVPVKVFFLLFCYVWLRGTLPRTQVRPAHGARLEDPDPVLRSSGC